MRSVIRRVPSSASDRGSLAAWSVSIDEQSVRPVKYEEIQKGGVPQNGWFIREDTINMDDLGKITEDSYGKSPFFNR